jgi:hypothetical protein
VIHPQRLANQALRVLDLGIKVFRRNINELSADINKKHLEPQPLSDFDSVIGF